jgi:hypothetical protein
MVYKPLAAKVALVVGSQGLDTGCGFRICRGNLSGDSMLHESRPVPKIDTLVPAASDYVAASNTSLTNWSMAGRITGPLKATS